MGRSRPAGPDAAGVDPVKRAFIALLALMPATAYANAGVGYFMVAMPVVALALIPAILLEAPVLGYLLKLPFRRAALLSDRMFNFDRSD